MNETDTIEIIALCNLVSYDSKNMPETEEENINRVRQDVSHLVDIFFEDSGFNQLSDFFNRIKDGLKNAGLSKDNEIYMYREIITYITDQYNKKYGEDAALRVFMHLNLL